MNLLTIQVKNIKSYEREGAVVIARVRPDKFTDHEAHIGFEVKVLGRFAFGSMGTGTAYGRPTYETVEVGDQIRLGTCTRQENMKQRSSGTQQLQTAGNR